MEECELCGRDMNVIHTVNVEGAELRVCAKCAVGKKILHTENQSVVQAKGSTIKKKSEEDAVELVSDYGTRIRKARENLRLPVKVLAEMLNEKERFLTRVESQKTVPPDNLVKKIEKVLNISLFEEV